MITRLSVYIIAQLTRWVNSSHDPQVVFQMFQYGWKEHGYQIMIMSMYIVAQRTVWMNPSQHPQVVFQYMVGKNMGLRLWSLVWT